VLALKRHWALELCRIEKGGENLTFCTLCILKLPAVHPSTQVDLQCANRTSSAPASSSAPTRRSTLPFRSSPSDSLLSFTVTEKRSERPDEKRTFYFYALPSTLRALVEAVIAQASKKVAANNKIHRPKWLRRHTHHTLPKMPTVMPWDDWGPKTTRWVDIGYLSVHYSVRQSLSGMRCALSERSSTGRKVRVMDFNPGRLRRVVAVRESGKNGVRVLDRLAVTSPNTIKAGRCFLHDFESSLPYYELKRSGPIGDLLMDDEWIAQIQVRLSVSIAWPICDLNLITLSTTGYQIMRDILL
jgi:hypothetical protein